jgi:hypothetical protein
MAWRSDPAEFDKPLTKEDLAERRRALSMLSEYSVRDAYRLAWERCKMQGDGFPALAPFRNWSLRGSFSGRGDGGERPVGAKAHEINLT